MSNPENPQETDDTSSAPDDKSSLLDQIIKTSQEEKIWFEWSNNWWYSSLRGTWWGQCQTGRGVKFAWW